MQLKKRLLLLTGGPGIGKTSIVLKVVEALRAMGYRVGGMMSCEVRSLGSRIGFRVLDVGDGERGWLARTDQVQGPRVGKYRVNINDLESIGVQAIAKAVENSDVVVVDEIGPMEMFSERFEECVKVAVESRKLVISVVHWRLKNRLTDEIKQREDAEVFVVTLDNRATLHQAIVEKALRFFSGVIEE